MHSIDNQFLELLRQGDFDKARKAVKGLVNIFRTNLDRVKVSSPPTFLGKAEKAPHRLVYLPIEIKDREFESKLFLAKAFLALGIDVVIGQTWSITSGLFKDLPRGVVLFKTLNAIDAHNMYNARVAGHFTAALDEEAFTRPVSDDIYKININREALQNCCVLYTQGDEQSAKIEELFNRPSFVVGNPRADVIASKKWDGSGGHDLICGMAGTINGVRGIYNTISATIGQLCKGEHAKLAVDMLEKAALRELEVFPEVMEALCTSKDAVFRPHPSEDPTFWQNILDTGSPEDPLVRFTGSSISHMVNSSKVFHVAECGTGFEAELLGAPSHSLGGDKPNYGPDFLFRTKNGNAAGRLAVNMLSMGFDLRQELSRDKIKEVLTQRKSTFQPTTFHRRKFPTTETEEIVTGTGASLDRVSKIDDNLWYVEAEY